MKTTLQLGAVVSLSASAKKKVRDDPERGMGDGRGALGWG